MYPKTLALIDDDKEHSEFLAQHLRELGIEVTVYSDSNNLLADVDAFAFEFFVVDLMLPGVDGVELIKILRKRTHVGILVVSGRLGPEVFKSVITAGADMHLAKPVQFEQVAVAVEAVHRRAAASNSSAQPWKLDRRLGELVAPDGARIALSDIDQAVVECFVKALGEPVSRDTLCERLGRDTGQDAEIGLSATIYRLRRRIERATPLAVPLHTKSRIGYVFRAPLLQL